MKKSIFWLVILASAILSSCTKTIPQSGQSGFNGFSSDTTIDVVLRVPAQSYPQGYSQVALISGDSVRTVSFSTLHTEGAFDYITQRVHVTPDVNIIRFSFDNCAGNKYSISVIRESDLYQKFINYN